MKYYITVSILICSLLFSCHKKDYVQTDIEQIIEDYSNIYKLKTTNILEEFSAKQSYEVGFYINNSDTLLYISRMKAYANKEISVISHSPFPEKLDLNNYKILDFPLYMGSYYFGKDSIPIHIYDIIDKVGKDFYSCNFLSNFDFDEYYITEDYEEDSPPDIWIYRKEEERFLKIMETDTMPY